VWIGMIQDRSRKRNTYQTSPQQLGTVPNARRICNPNNAEQFPAGSIQQIKEYRSRHAFSYTKSIHLQTLKCTDQGKQIKECNATPNIAPTTRNSSQQDLYDRSRNTDHGVHFQTRKVCISKHSNAQIKENGSRNATPNIAPTTQQLNNSAQFPSHQNRSRNSNAQINEYGSRNATPNIAHTAQIKEYRSGAVIKGYRSRNAFPTQC
jgi:hypothetical protein